MVLILRRGNVRHQAPDFLSLDLRTSILVKAAARWAQKKVCAISALCAISPSFYLKGRGELLFASCRIGPGRFRTCCGVSCQRPAKRTPGRPPAHPKQLLTLRPSGAVGGWRWDLHDDIDPDCEHLVSRGVKYVLGMAVRERGGNPGSEKIGLESGVLRKPSAMAKPSQAEELMACSRRACPQDDGFAGSG